MCLIVYKAVADGCGQGYIEVDEGLFRYAPFRPGRGSGIAGGGESRVDLFEIEMETADGSVAEQIHPALRRTGIGSQPIARSAPRIGFGSHAAETGQSGDPDTGAQDRIVDHHDRDGRSGDDVGLAFGIRLGQVEAGIACGQGLDFRFRNADQDNGPGMADQPGTRQAGIGTDGGKHMDGLARITDRADEIGGEERPGDDPDAAQHWGHRQVLADGAIGIGPGDPLAGLDLRQVAGKPGSVEAGWLGGAERAARPMQAASAAAH